MSGRFSCNRCQSHKVRRISLATDLHEWQCQDCGDSCKHPCHSKAAFPKLDTVVGLMVLATLTCLALCCLT